MLLDPMTTVTAAQPVVSGPAMSEETLPDLVMRVESLSNLVFKS